MHILTKTIEKHVDCLKCQLGTNRIQNKEKVVFTFGMFDSIGLIIIPKPVYNEKDKPAPYGSSTEELKILRAIWEKTGLDADNWSITTGIGCKGEITKDNVDACSERLSDILFAISPKIVVTCGNKSAYAFTKKAPPKTYGWQNDEDVKHYRWMHSYDISEYMELRSAEPQKALEIAKQMMEHWSTLKTTVDLM